MHQSFMMFGEPSPGATRLFPRRTLLFFTALKKSGVLAGHGPAPLAILQSGNDDRLLRVAFSVLHDRAGLGGYLRQQQGMRGIDVLSG
jgi:hypothetical protein